MRFKFVRVHVQGEQSWKTPYEHKPALRKNRVVDQRVSGRYNARAAALNDEAGKDRGMPTTACAPSRVLHIEFAPIAARVVSARSLCRGSSPRMGMAAAGKEGRVRLKPMRATEVGPP